MIHLHAMVGIPDGVPMEPPHRAAGAGSRNSFSLPADTLTLSRFEQDPGIPHAVAEAAAEEKQEPAVERDAFPDDDDAEASPGTDGDIVAAPAEREGAPAEGKPPRTAPAVSPAATNRSSRPGTAARSRPASAAPKRLNVVDGYGRLEGPEDAEGLAAEALEAAELELPDTEATVLVADGAAITPQNAAKRRASMAPPTQAKSLPLTVAQPLSLDPEPVRVPRAVQQGTGDVAVERARASYLDAVAAAEEAKARVAPLKHYFRTWRRRADGSDFATGPPVLFSEYKDPMWHNPPLAPVRLPPAGATKAGGDAAQPKHNGAADIAEPTLMPFFEPTAVGAEFFYLAVAAVLASNGHHVDDADAAVAIPSSADDAAAPVETPPLPSPCGEIFAKWIAGASRLVTNELLTCRFFVAPGSQWEHRHDSSVDPTADLEFARQAADDPELAEWLTQQLQQRQSASSLAVPSHFTTVDTLLPAAEDRRPCFGRTEEKKELWLSLLMKAYAVAHPKNIGLAALHEDSPASALEALTGGTPSLARWRMGDSEAVGMVWWMLQLCAEYHLPCVMCRRPIDEADTSDNDGESEVQPSTDSAPTSRPDSRIRDAASVTIAAQGTGGGKGSRAASRATISTPPPTGGSRPGSTMRIDTPSGVEPSATAPVTIDNDAAVARFRWAQGDVFVTACEYRFDTGIAETLADADDADFDTRSVSSAATALTTASNFQPGGQSGATELHRLIKLRQLYLGNRSEDETGWLPPWHDESNSWTDVVSGSSLGGTMRSRATSVMSSATTSTARAAAASVNARWTKATRRALAHPAPDERLAWMDAATFVNKYNTILFARNLAQHPNYRLHFGSLDRTVRRDVAAETLPAFLLQVQKRDSGAANSGGEDWRNNCDEGRSKGIAELLAGADMDADLGLNDAAASGIVETDDDDVDGADDERSVSGSSRVASSVAEAPGGVARMTSSLVMRVTVSQPTRTAPSGNQAAPAHHSRASLRSEALGSAAARVTAAPPPPPLELQVLRAVGPQRVPCVRALGADGVQVSSLPTHSRVGCRVVSMATTHDAVETVYEVEANTGFYNLVVTPPVAEDMMGMSTSHVASHLAQQPFAVAVALVKNAPSYEVSTRAL
jgi:hypothetical protein